MVSAKAGTIDGVKVGNVITITVPVTKAYKAIGTVDVKFTEKVTIKSVDIGATSYKTEVITKFGDDKVTFSADVLTNFVNLVKKGTSVTVVVTGAGGDSTFTVNLVVDSVVTVGSLGGRVDQIITDWNVTLTKAQLEAVYGPIEDTTEFVLTLGTEIFDIAKDASGDWMIAGDTMLSADNETEVKTAVITLK